MGLQMTEEKGAKDGERIAKRMARAGVCSRREAEVMILEGRVSVDGKKIITPATLVTDESVITVDGKAINDVERTRVWRYHKPRGLLTTNRDPQGRATIYDNLPRGLPRVISVGRLDYNSEGLLLLTNDGGVARKLELPDTGWARRYRVRAFGTLSPAQIAQLARGMTVDGVRYGGIEAAIDRQQGGNVWITMTLNEGKNREIRKVLEALGLQVSRLIRVAYGPFQLGRLEPGEIEEVPGKILAEQLGLEKSSVHVPRAKELAAKPARPKAENPAAEPQAKPKPYRAEIANPAARAAKNQGKPLIKGAKKPAAKSSREDRRR